MRKRPLVLDLFCGAGGAAAGYQQAGFDVVGVDVVAQKRYPFDFVLGDATQFPLTGFDLIHASPPCHDHSSLKFRSGTDGTAGLLDHMIARLLSQPTPWVVENVVGSGLDPAIRLCGSSFGLGVRRHRLFRSSLPLYSLPCEHKAQGTPVGCYGHGGGKSTRGVKGTVVECRAAMGIPWMTGAELAQAIPPAYTRFIGDQILGALISEGNRFWLLKVNHAQPRPTIPNPTAP